MCTYVIVIICVFRRNHSIPVAFIDHRHTQSGSFLDISFGALHCLRRLEYFDVSFNGFTGHVDVLLSSSLKVVDCSNNKFTTAGFWRFHKSFRALKKVDPRPNLISQDVSELFLNIPPVLKDCNFSNIDVRRTLPKEFPLEQVLFFSMSNNRISGPLPEFPNTSRKLKHLVLANNHLAGTIFSLSRYSGEKLLTH